MRFLFVIWLGLLPLTGAAGEQPRVPASETVVDFVHDVVPVLSRQGCNLASCHGKAEGQNGFKLSVFGNDPQADYSALVLEARGRRVMPAAPDASLLLLKASGGIPHEGGLRMERDSRAYQRIRAWISNGAPYSSADRPELTDLRIEPERKIVAFGETLPLKVIARFADGREEDVTWQSVFHSNDGGMAEVSENGRVAIGATTGQVALMARFHGQVAVFQALIPQPGEFGEFPQRPIHNVIDELVDRNLELLNVHPSEMADDDEFFRRVYLDSTLR